MAAAARPTTPGLAALWERLMGVIYFGLYMLQVTRPRTQTPPPRNQGEVSVGLEPSQRCQPSSKGGQARERPVSVVAEGEKLRLLQARVGCGSAHRRLVGQGGESWVWDVSRKLGKRQLYNRKGRAGGVPPRAPVCVSEASLNGQRLTLWGPLLGQRWEGLSGLGWGFSKSGNLRKSSGKQAARVLPTRGLGGRAGVALPSHCPGPVAGAWRSLMGLVQGRPGLRSCGSH